MSMSSDMKKEPGFRVTLPFGGEEDFRKQSEAIRKEANRKAALLIDENNKRERIAGAIRATDHLAHEEFDTILKRRIQQGYPLNRIPVVIGEIEIENRQHEKEEAQNRIKAEQEAKERNTPLKRLLRSWSSRNVAAAYKADVDSVLKEPINGQVEIRNKILNTPVRKLWPTKNVQIAEQEKTEILTWLNSVIDSQTKKDPSLGKRIEQFLHLE